MFDCDEYGGAGAVVPGSHILPDAPGQTLKTPLASGYNEKMGKCSVNQRPSQIISLERIINVGDLLR